MATLYMFRAPFAHRQEFRNCVCRLWYWHVDLCNEWWHNLVHGVMVNVVQYNVVVVVVVVVVVGYEISFP